MIPFNVSILAITTLMAITTLIALSNQAPVRASGQNLKGFAPSGPTAGCSALAQGGRLFSSCSLSDLAAPTWLHTVRVYPDYANGAEAVIIHVSLLLGCEVDHITSDRCDFALWCP